MIMLEFYVLSSVATIGVCEPGVCVRACVCVCAYWAECAFHLRVKTWVQG